MRIFLLILLLGFSRIILAEDLDELVGLALHKIRDEPLLRTGEKLVITAATGDRYRLGLAKLLFTCKKTNPGSLFIVLMINWEEEQKAQFQEVFQGYPIVYTSIDQPITTHENPDIRSQAFKLKASLFKHAYLTIGPPLLWIDADVVVLNSLDSIFAKLEDADFSSSFNPFQNEKQKFSAQAVGIGRGHLAGEFFERACFHAYVPGLKNFHEQVGMCRAYYELKSRGLLFKKMHVWENFFYYMPKVVICAYEYEGFLKWSGMEEELNTLLDLLSTKRG
jgi:hypothetical protein